MGKRDRKRKICCLLLTSFTERSLSISKRITNLFLKKCDALVDSCKCPILVYTGAGVHINLQKLA